MTTEARAILLALWHGLSINPFAFNRRAWLIAHRYARRYQPRPTLPST